MIIELSMFKVQAQNMPLANAITENISKKKLYAAQRIHDLHKSIPVEEKKTIQQQEGNKIIICKCLAEIKWIISHRWRGNWLDVISSGRGRPLVCVTKTETPCLPWLPHVCNVCLVLHWRIKHGNSDFNAVLLQDWRQDIAFVAVKSFCIISSTS